METRSSTDLSSDGSRERIMDSRSVKPLPLKLSDETTRRYPSSSSFSVRSNLWIGEERLFYKVLFMEVVREERSN
jgi:hypothetical protein